MPLLFQYFRIFMFLFCFSYLFFCSFLSSSFFFQKMSLKLLQMAVKRLFDLFVAGFRDLLREHCFQHLVLCCSEQQ